MPWIAAHGAAAIALLGLDALWLGVLARGFYQREFGGMLLDRPNLGAAAAFYAIYIGAVVFFAVKPALAGGGWPRAALHGALLGLAAYSAYGLTNLATLKGFPAKVVAPDLIAGMVVTTAAALAGYAAASRVS